MPCGFSMNQNSDIPRLIRSKVAEELVNLPPHLQSWLRNHLVEPRLSRLSLDHNGSSFKHFWLVTDHNGEQDSSYRIVYDGEQEVFGLECTLDSGVEWLMGSYGSLSDTVENM
jgi:hypothetical protein